MLHVPICFHLHTSHAPSSQVFTGPRRCFFSGDLAASRARLDLNLQHLLLDLSLQLCQSELFHTAVDDHVRQQRGRAQGYGLAPSDFRHGAKKVPRVGIAAQCRLATNTVRSDAVRCHASEDVQWVATIGVAIGEAVTSRLQPMWRGIGNQDANLRRVWPPGQMQGIVQACSHCFRSIASATGLHGVDILRHLRQIGCEGMAFRDVGLVLRRVVAVANQAKLNLGTMLLRDLCNDGLDVVLCCLDVLTHRASAVADETKIQFGVRVKTRRSCLLSIIDENPFLL
mmetsp:Transcript_132128/g.313195  ORF Transcript_132128/g.313195 Transcript_132128/m.313195 type:complete len:284 (-) Transcript_132128:145-996(-)